MYKSGSAPQMPQSTPQGRKATMAERNCWLANMDQFGESPAHNYLAVQFLKLMNFCIILLAVSIESLPILKFTVTAFILCF